MHGARLRRALRLFAYKTVVIAVFALTLAFSPKASAEAPAPDKSCWIDAKTGKPVPAPRAGAVSGNGAENEKLTRVRCRVFTEPADLNSPGLESLRLSAAPLLTKAPPIEAPAWWASAEALVWWTKSSPLPSTLTTFAPGTPSATTGFGGALGVPGTTVLSPDNLRYDPSAGARFVLGRWLDPAHRWGLEAEGFFLGKQTADFSEASDGTQPLRVPFFNVPPGAGFPLGSSSFVLADPAFASGSQVINSSLKFWGAEGNVFYHLIDARSYDVSLLAGFRYIDLREDLSIASNETLLPAVGVLGSATTNDSFSTRNQFYGGQVGLKARAQFGAFDGTVLGKVAFGDNRQTVGVDGSIDVVGFGFPATGVVLPGGLFAQGTNIGTDSRNRFAVVPEVNVQVGYTLPYGARVFVGYNFIYLSSVVRPGNQIDTTLNLTGNPGISGIGATLVGAPRPEPQFNGSSFWAQGINFGLSLEF